MGDLLEKVLSKTGIPCFYLKRPTDNYNCIVYTYKEYLGAISDNDEENIKYDIYLNLIVQDNIKVNVNKIKEVLKEEKFKKVIINAPEPFEINGVDHYQITMNYTKRMAAK